MRHVSRTHRVDLDWLFESINLDSDMCVRYVLVNQQIVDIAATSSFTRDKWNELTTVFGIVSGCFHRSHISAVAFFGSACASHG